jgi:hypothetical protein
MDANAIQLVSNAIRDRLAAAFAAQGIRGDVYVGPLDDRDAGGRPRSCFCIGSRSTPIFATASRLTASLSLLVSGQIVTLSSAANRSDWMITAGRGLPVKSPPRSATVTTSPRRIGLIEDADGLQPVYDAVVAVELVQPQALLPHFLAEAWPPCVRRP